MMYRYKRLKESFLQNEKLSCKTPKHLYTGCPKKKDNVTLSHNFRLNYSNSKFQLLISSELLNRIERDFLHNV